MRLYANPYDRSAKGFYFNDLDEYEEKYEENLPVEEYEIDFIDGTAQEAALFNAAKVDAGTLESWFDFIEEGEDHLWPAVYYFLGVGYDLNDAISKAEDNSAVEGTAKEAVEQWIDDMGGPEQLGKETLEQYFDYDSYARDMELNGEANEFDFAGETFTIIGSDWVMAKRTHKDVEFAVDDASGHQRTFKSFDEAAGFAVAMAASGQEVVNLDALVWSKAGARFYGGSDAVEQYNEDPEASVFERFEIRVNFVGRVA